MKQLIKPAHGDPHNSVDLFDANRKNDLGEMFCVAPAILPFEVNRYWQHYKETEAMQYGLVNPATI